jgi:hypothetical protein
VSESLYGREGTTPLGVTLVGTGIAIPAVPGKRIRIYAMFASALADTEITFQSNGATISGQFALVGRGGFVLPLINKAWMVGAPGQSINVVMTVATTLGLQVVYDISE